MDNNKIWSLMARKLSGEASSQELAELAAQMRHEPSLQYAYEMMSEYWPISPSDQEYENIESRFQHILEQLHTIKEAEDAVFVRSGGVKIFQKRSIRIAMAAALLLMIAVGYFMVNDKKSAPLQIAERKSEVSTRYGSRSRVVLPDGTLVWLNVGSKLTYDNKDFAGVSRDVYLTGEAFFDVAKDPGTPFILHTQKIDILVLGTSFDVKAYPNDETIETTLLRGAIEVQLHDHEDKKIRLKPHQKLTVYKDDRLETRQLSAADSIEGKKRPYAISPMRIIPADSLVVETSWLQNKLAFQSESFPDLALQLQRWFNVRINFSDSEVKKYRFTGVFENETLDQVLRALQITAPFHYRIENNEVYISNP